MTLFSLNKDYRKNRRTFFIYLGVTVFCGIFGLVYETFSHGVVSFFMLFGFLFPLVLGLAPYSILFITKTIKGPDTFASYLYNAGVATVSVGSYFKGVLDIYGTTRDVYVIIYFVVGGVLLLLGISSYIISLIKSGDGSENNE